MVALANHPDSQPRRILSHAVTGRWLRPQIEPPPQPSDHPSGTHESPVIGLPVLDGSQGKASTTSVRRTKKGKKRRNLHDKHVLRSPDASTIGDIVAPITDPNEPRYCRCRNVSYGDVRTISPSSAFLRLTTHRRWCNVRTVRNANTIG